MSLFKPTAPYQNTTKSLNSRIPPLETVRSGTWYSVAGGSAGSGGGGIPPNPLNLALSFPKGVQQIQTVDKVISWCSVFRGGIFVALVDCYSITFQDTITAASNIANYSPDSAGTNFSIVMDSQNQYDNMNLQMLLNVNTQLTFQFRWFPNTMTRAADAWQLGDTCQPYISIHVVDNPITVRI